MCKKLQKTAKIAFYCPFLHLTALTNG